MTDHEAKLLKWVAEELLRLKPGKYAAPDYLLWHDKSGKGYFESDLQSWHGIGLVVEEMERREWYFGAFDRSILKNNKGDRHLEWSANFYREGEFEGQNWTPGSQAWFAVYGAARRAVTND